VPVHEWDDPSPPDPTQVNPNPNISLETEIPDEDLEAVLPGMPNMDAFDQSCGVSQVIYPNIGLDTLVDHRPHFLGETKGEPVTLRLSENLSKMIDRIIHDRSTGYRTKSEFLRDAAFHLARALVQQYSLQDPRLVSYLNSANLAAQLDFNARLREQVEKAEHDLTDYLLYVIERGGLGEAVRAIDKYESTARTIPIDWWRDRWLHVLTTNPLVQHILSAHQNAQSKAHGVQSA
jgi:metal-responsive CopG/Arc/MetJ family transcriptional regulator